MLQEEFKGIEEAVRNMFGQYIGWFVFFTGVNLAGYGWFAQQLAEHKNIAKWVVLIVCVYFVFQNIVAAIASRRLILYFRSSQQRMELLLPELERNSAYSIKAQIACPFELYIQITKLVMQTFLSMILLWIAFTIFAFTH